MGKSDRALVFGALAFWAGAGWPLPAWAADAAMQITVLLLVVTIVNRVRAGLAEAAHDPH